MTEKRFTLPEDPETKAGWGPIDLDVFFQKFPELVEWHDKITSKGSFAQKVGIPNWAVVAAWKAMVEHRMQEADMGKQGFIKMVWRGSNTFFRYFHRFFYEGPLK